MAADAAKATLLVIKLGALGDVVIALPYIDRIRAAWPGHRVVVLTAPEYAPLLRLLPGIEVVAYPRKGFVAMARLLRWLIGLRAGIVFDLQGSLRSRVMTRLSLAGMRVGRRPSGAYTHAPPAGTAGVHACDWLGGVLAAGGVGGVAPGWRLPVTPAARGRVGDWLRTRGLAGRRLVLLHAGSSPRWPSKRWPEAYFRELAVALAAQGLHPVWIGGAAEGALNHSLAAAAGTDAGGVFDYVELAALARHAAFAVSNDSGPMHILAAAGLPVYACFGPTDWRRSHAPGQAGRVLSAGVPCSPCGLRTCPPERAHACMRDLLPGQVLARLQADGLP